MNNLASFTDKMSGKRPGKKAARLSLSSQESCNTKSAQTTNTSDNLPDPLVLKSLNQSILQETNILQKTILEQTSDNKVTRRPTEVLLPVNSIEQLETNTSFVESLSTKLCETILSNEEFTQKICDSIALDCKKDIATLQEALKVTRAKTHDLEEKIEMQEQ